MIDVFVQDEGTVVAFEPRTRAASDWIDEHVQAESWQFVGGALVVDHRFARDLAAGMVDAGLRLR